MYYTDISFSKKREFHFKETIWMCSWECTQHLLIIHIKSHDGVVKRLYRYMLYNKFSSPKLLSPNVQTLNAVPYGLAIISHSSVRWISNYLLVDHQNCGQKCLAIPWETWVNVIAKRRPLHVNCSSVNKQLCYYTICFYVDLCCSFVELCL